MPERNVEDIYPIPDDDLKELAELYDKWVNSLSPFESGRQEVKEQFWVKLNELYRQYGANVGFDTFRRGAVQACRAYLRKNFPADPTDSP